MTNTAIPRRPSTASDPQGMVRALSDLQDAIRMLPEVEFRTFVFSAGESVTVQTKVTKPRFITANARNLTTGEPVADVGASFARDAKSGGLMVTFSGLLLAANRYEVTLKIEGDR